MERFHCEEDPPLGVPLWVGYDDYPGCQLTAAFFDTVTLGIICIEIELSGVVLKQPNYYSFVPLNYPEHGTYCEVISRLESEGHAEYLAQSLRDKENHVS